MKTINSLSYQIADAWLEELFNFKTPFSISDVIEHIPIFEYSQDEHFNDLMADLYNYIYDQIEANYPDEKTLCEEFSDGDVKEDDSILVIEEDDYFISIPTWVSEQLKTNVENLTIESFGNELVIHSKFSNYNDESPIKENIDLNCINHPELENQIRFKARNFFEEAKNCMENDIIHFTVWFEKSENAIHILIREINKNN